MFNFLWNKSDFDEAIQLMQQGKYSEAKAAFSTVSSKDKDYPRAKFNLFSLCCSGFLNGRFYIDEGVKHLKEAYTYKHPVADIFFPVIEYVKKRRLRFKTYTANYRNTLYISRNKGICKGWLS